MINYFRDYDYGDYPEPIEPTDDRSWRRFLLMAAVVIVMAMLWNLYGDRARAHLYPHSTIRAWSI